MTSSLPSSAPNVSQVANALLKATNDLNETEMNLFFEAALPGLLRLLGGSLDSEDDDEEEDLDNLEILLDDD